MPIDKSPLPLEKGNKNSEVGDAAQPISFLAKLQRGQDEALARAADTWWLRLERVRGKMGDDGIERVPTQTLFDILEMPERSRGAGACRRLAKLMRELGWSPIKARGLTQSGLRDQVRGYARDNTGLSQY
jgi:hypothetical protein